MADTLTSASSRMQLECSRESLANAPAPAVRGALKRILIAEDDRVSRRMLGTILADWGFDVVAACDGLEAWQILQSTDAPRLAILDWLMPGMDGLEICRQARALAKKDPLYLILLTVKTNREDIVTGLRGGADDYMSKPFDLAELEARLQVAMRILDLQSDLAARIGELEAAISQVKELQGLLPVCMYCKKIRNDQDFWEHMESYISAHSKANFTHGICPHCYERMILPLQAAVGASEKRD